MRRSALFTTTLLLALLVFSFGTLAAEENSNVDWEKYSTNLVIALKSTNPGVQQSAMQMVIRYADNVNVTAARYEVMDKFMNSEDQKVRQLALVTLSKIDNFFDMGLLQLQYDFEENPIIQKQIGAVLIAKGRMNQTGFAPDAQVAGLVPTP